MEQFDQKQKELLEEAKWQEELLEQPHSGKQTNAQQSQPQSDSSGRSEPDLLSQIVAEEDKEEKQKKQKHSLFIMIFVKLMRLTFYLDAVRRKYEKVFLVLNAVYAVFMGVLYLGGITALCVLLYSYSQFPYYVEAYFRDNKIEVKNLTVDKYDFSKIELKNLTDSKGSYRIKNVVIHSTFSDFLQRRVKVVVLDGVKLTVKEGKTDVDLGHLPAVLMNLNQNRIGQRGVKVDSLVVSNAVLEVSGQSYKIPINFSLTGVYENGANISIPFFIKQEDINIMGTVSVSEQQKQKIWTVDIPSGTLTLPRRSPENLTGKFTLKTEGLRLVSIEGKASLSLGKNSKSIGINLRRGKSDLYTGDTVFSFVNSDPYDRTKELNSTIRLSFDGLKINSFTNYETTTPVRLTVQSFHTENLSLTNLSGTLKGNMSCEKLSCQYRLKEPSTIYIRNSKMNVGSDVIQSTNDYSLVLLPSDKNAQTVSWKGDRINFNLAIKQMDFKGYRTSPNNTINLDIKDASLVGHYNLGNQTRRARLDIKQFDYETPYQIIKKAHLSVQDIFDSNMSFAFESPSIFLKESELIKQPFKLSINKNGFDTKVFVSAYNDVFRASFSGASNFPKKEFSGNVLIEPFEVRRISQRPFVFSSLFPEEISNASGRISALGNISWKGGRQIQGPIYISFENVDFDMANVRVRQLNSVLTAQTLFPFVTLGNQQIFVKTVKGPLQLQNLDASVKFDTQLMRLNSFSAEIAGVPLTIDSALIPYKLSLMTLYLRNSDFNLSLVNPYLNIPNLSFSGKASLQIPLELRKDKISIQNGELKLSNVNVKYTSQKKGNKKDFFEGNGSYLIRSGTGTINSVGNSSQTEILISTEGRLMPSNEKKNFRQTLTEDLNLFFKPVEPADIPASIVEKQRIISPMP